jgi:dihydropteroate synthase
MLNDNYFFKFGKIGYDLSKKTYVMGVLNVTPDSFSDGGKFINPDTALTHAKQMEAEGVDFIDIGGQSTRPGAEEITTEEELKRVIPVIKKLVKEVQVPLSIDTYRSQVAEEALKLGAHIVNDISGLNFDEKMADTISMYNGTVILMHIKGTPRNMQDEPHYDNVVEEVRLYLEKSIWKASVSGINQMIIDPGIGFGKTVEHNLALIKNIGRLKELDCPVMLGVSRKSLIEKMVGGDVNDRLEGTVTLNAIGIMNGVNIIRVHDAKAGVRTAKICDTYFTS